MEVENLANLVLVYTREHPARVRFPWAVSVHENNHPAVLGRPYDCTDNDITCGSFAFVGV